MLKLFNTLTRQKEEFQSIEPNSVRMYVCGMTVYDLCHVGHARVMVVFDMVRKWFETSGYDVTYVRNITDIDDKIIARARDNEETYQQLTSRFIDAMNQDAASLGVVRPDIEPKATENIPQMIELIGALISKGYAYVGESGDVYYSVSLFEKYGQLSGKTLEDLRAGERVEVDLAKKHPMDFVLWKTTKPGEPSWSSPWGDGRPGWHIECSAMSERYLGKYFDIHGGGQDLQFPHHENEIAQSEGAHGAGFVKYWMHNGFVRVDNEKMSKSLGNFFTVREVLDKFDPEVLRFFILRAHYRSPLNYSDKHLEDARLALSRMYTALKDVDPPSQGSLTIDWQHAFAHRFKEAMDDDFNTPEAISVLFDIVSELNRSGDVRLAYLLRALAAELGLLDREPALFLQSREGLEMSSEEIDAMIVAREEARSKKDFKEADRLRDELTAAGITLEDSAGKTTWRRA
jgi:cysteinyl-tRNA synthetase